MFSLLLHNCSNFATVMTHDVNVFGNRVAKVAEARGLRNAALEGSKYTDAQIGKRG